jgi:alcohol dehydrogenase (cytochrome c)
MKITRNVLCCLLLATCTTVTNAATAPATGPTMDDLRSSASSGDWLMTNKTYAGQRYSNLSQINSTNAASLVPVCTWQSGVENASAQSTPVVYAGTMYVSTGDTTAAIDAQTCAEKWRYAWTPRGKELSSPNRGVAIGNGLVVRGTGDGYLIAIDAATGALKWSHQLVSANDNYYLSMPAMIYDGLVIYGTAGADWGARGWIGAFKLDDGTPVWKFDALPQSPADGPGATWRPADALAHGGGSFWTPVSLDAEKGILYAPVGNPAPDFYGAARDGDNLYTCSVVAIDVHTGKLLWYRQMVAHDFHDWDLTQTGPLFSASVDGATHDLMVVSGKNGMLSVLDRDSHQELFSLATTSRQNVDLTPTPASPVHVCPGLLGGEEWSTAAFNPAAHAAYVPATDWCGTLQVPADAPTYQEGTHYYGGSVTQDPPADARGWLTAFDVTNGKVLWKYHANSPMVANVVATAGGVIFAGEMSGDLLVLDASNGKIVCRHPMGASLAGGIITYAVSGKQYVAVETGYVSKFYGGTDRAPAYTILALRS